MTKKRTSKLEESFQGALGRLAESLGITPAEFDRSIRQAADTLKPTPQCLTLEEIRLFGSLPAIRMKHAGECAFCQRLANAIQPSKAGTDAFVKAAVYSGKAARAIPFE